METRDGEALIWLARRFRKLEAAGVESQRLIDIIESMKSIISDGEGEYWAFEFPNV